MRKLVNLRELRERAALSQGELASEAGISKNAVGQLERGEFNPRPATVRRLAEALGVRPDELWESTSPKARARLSHEEPTEQDEREEELQMERRTRPFDMVHELVTRQIEEDRQLMARARESESVQASFVRHENEAMKRLLEYPPEEVAELCVDLMRDRLERDLEPKLETSRASSAGADVQDAGSRGGLSER
jgi:transcriptional regulator with XRE-family HTH domain